MHRIRLIHWNAQEAKNYAANLEAMGYEVSHKPLNNPAALKKMKEEKTEAFVIDLSRLPSQGRDLTLMLREAKSIRYIPLVFVDGDTEKVARIKEILPDAMFSNWANIQIALNSAIADPPQNPIVPKSRMDGYAGRPLPKKLGVKSQTTVILLDAPLNFLKTIGDLPEGAQFLSDFSQKHDLILWFVASQSELKSRISELTARVSKGGMWIIWPKKASGVKSDLTQNVVRNIGLDNGLVDYKVCAVDETWSGLLFARRK